MKADNLLLMMSMEDCEINIKTCVFVGFSRCKVEDQNLMADHHCSVWGFSLEGRSMLISERMMRRGGCLFCGK